MAYETGSASNPNDLLDKLRAFLLTQGWTINDFSNIGAGRRLHIEKGPCFFNFRSYHGDARTNNADLNADTAAGFWGIGIYGSTGYNGAEQWNRQPGYPNYNAITRGGYANNMTESIVAYHFFTYSDIDEVHVVMEFKPSQFQIISFGKLALYNPLTPGGQWFAAPTDRQSSLPHVNGVDNDLSAELIPFRGPEYMTSTTGGSCSGYVKVNTNDHDGWGGSAPTLNGTPSSVAITSNQGWDRLTLPATVSAFNWRTQMLPIMLAVVKNDSGAAPLGEIKHLRRLDITNYLPGEEFTLGPDTWKVFPWYVKGGYSFNRGIAVRKVA